jgi:AcrR family transcriptional regulator
MSRQDAPPRRSRAEAKAETRRRLCTAAETVFRRDGYHGASLDRIAAEAGFTTGAVYSTFGSKADVMLSLLAVRAEQRRASWAEMLEGASTADEFTTELARRGAREVFTERDWLAVVGEFMIVIGRDEELRARHADIHAANLTALTDAIRVSMERDGDRWTIEPGDLATVVSAMHRGLVLEGMVAPAPVSEEVVVEASRILLRGARASKERKLAE